MELKALIEDDPFAELQQRRKFIGIDPGLTGAVAILPDGLLFDTPIAEVRRGKRTKRVYLETQMAAILRPYAGGQTYAFLEAVHAMPEQGVASMFGFGEGFGSWKGILAALEIPVTMVTPQAWKKALMPGMGREKDAARVRALQLYPQLAPLLKLKRDIGRADALLIAEYGRRFG